MEKKNILKIFNDCFEEFFDNVVNIFPDDSDISATQTSIKLLRKNNPKLLITIWNDYVTVQYREQIDQGNLDYFLAKDYTEDLKQSINATYITDVINRIRNPLKQLNKDQLQSVLIYLQNLNILCRNYVSLI